MIQNVFAIFDSKVGAYLQPFFSPSEGAAIRAFMDAVGDKNSPFCKHPGDYTLFHLARFDDESGLFASLPTPVSMGVALHLLQAIEG